jgi:CRP/FNR family transcriptional regulator, anaerobic regulatory protein
MTEAGLRERVASQYPALAQMSAGALSELLARAELREVPAGTVMFDEGEPCGAFPMLLEGSIRVSKASANGRELQLYRVVPGEACVLTSGCLLGGAPYGARGVAEIAVRMLAIPAPVFARLLDTEPAFRAYVFALFSERMSELMQLVEAVAFRRLDRRLATLLLGKGKVLRTTHQQLAEELGTVREIVTRLLNGFAEQGLVALGREQIEIRDARALRELAGS